MKWKIDSDGCVASDYDDADERIDRKRVGFIIRRNLRRTVGQRRLGLIWLILDPILISVLYLFVFIVIRGTPNATVLFIGVSLYRVFRAAFKSGVNISEDFSMGIKAERITDRVVLHSEIRYRIVEATLSSVGICAILVIFGVTTYGLVVFAISAMILSVLSQGVAMNLTLMMKKLPDLQSPVDHLLLLMFFASPAFYSMTYTTGIHYEFNRYNPFAYFAEFCRYSAEVESAFPALIDIRTVIVMSLVTLIAIRGYVGMGRRRWEASVWS